MIRTLPASGGLIVAGKPCPVAVHIVRVFQFGSQREAFSKLMLKVVWSSRRRASTCAVTPASWKAATSVREGGVLIKALSTLFRVLNTVQVNSPLCGGQAGPLDTSSPRSSRIRTRSILATDPCINCVCVYIYSPVYTQRGVCCSKPPAGLKNDLCWLRCWRILSVGRSTTSRHAPLSRAPSFHPRSRTHPSY